MQIIKVTDIDKQHRIAIVVSREVQALADELVKEASERLQELEVPTDKLTVVYVPAADDIPLMAKMLTRQQDYSAIIALGVLIQAPTSTAHVALRYACQEVSLACCAPVIFGLLTAETQDQAQEWVLGPKGHRGREMADRAIEMLSVLQQLDSNALTE